MALESFGARLKRERERQNMTLDSVAAATKIGTRLLQALEDQQFDRLPGGIFNKGFVRAYARHLGLDEEQALADYMTAAGAPPVVKEPEALVAAIAARKTESRSERQKATSGGFPWSKITILLLAVAVGLVIWSGHARKKSQHDGAPTPKPASAAPAPGSSQILVPENGGRDSSAQSPHGQYSAPAVAATLQTDASLPAKSSSAAGPFSVVIHAREDSWLAITIDDGETISHLLAAQSDKTITARQKIVVKAGNAGGLDFSFNGTPLPAQGEKGEPKTLTFGANGLRSSAARTRDSSQN